jgi:hypothetical protein
MVAYDDEEEMNDREGFFETSVVATEIAFHPDEIGIIGR